MHLPCTACVHCTKSLQFVNSHKFRSSCKFMHKKIDKKQIQTVAISGCPVRSVGKWQLVCWRYQIWAAIDADPNIIIVLNVSKLYVQLLYIIKIIFLIIQINTLNKFVFRYPPYCVRTILIVWIVSICDPTCDTSQHDRCLNASHLHL